MPDDQMFCDEFIGEVVRIGRLKSFHIELPTSEIRMHLPVLARCALVDTTDNSIHEFSGEGRTMGFALRGMREQVREHFGR